MTVDPGCTCSDPSIAEAEASVAEQAAIGVPKADHSLDWRAELAFTSRAASSPAQPSIHDPDDLF
jgi:hypothetical protein